MPFQPLLNHHQCYLSEYRSAILPQRFFVNWQKLKLAIAHIFTFFISFWCGYACYPNIANTSFESN